MRTYRKPNQSIYHSVITIGSFDGVHRGHQVVIKKTIALSRADALKAGVVTFDPLPQQFLYPDFHYLLTTLAEKKALLAKLGIDFLYLIEFNKSIQSLAPADFIQRQILESLHPAKIVIGLDHRFGKNGAGDVTLLKKLAKEFNFELIVVEELQAEGESIKSTRIRERLLLGDVKTANRLLGRNYSIEGAVTKGLGIGKLIGFPTVNLTVKEIRKLIPADGVYAVLVWLKGRKYKGAMNIGHRPTFGGSERTIETTLISPLITKNLYGQALRIEIIERLRPERKFPDAQTLAQQIKKDIEQTKAILKTKP